MASEILTASQHLPAAHQDFLIPAEAEATQLMPAKTCRPLRDSPDLAKTQVRCMPRLAWFAIAAITAQQHGFDPEKMKRRAFGGA